MVSVREVLFSSGLLWFSVLGLFPARFGFGPSLVRLLVLLRSRHGQLRVRLVEHRDCLAACRT